jgi:hypothetical protein
VDQYYHLPGASDWEQIPVALPGVMGKADEISASQVRADAVFVRFGGLVEEHVGTIANFGWSVVARPGFIANVPDPSIGIHKSANASQISAGKDAATGKDAVFINFGGHLYEHTGSVFAKGWKHVADDVTDFAGSQVQGDTVFVIKSGVLSEYVKGKGTFLADNVSGVSAGIDAHFRPAAFILTMSGDLEEHTGTNPKKGFTTIASGVTAMDASLTGPNTVFYTVGSPGDPAYDIHEHNGKGDTLLF